MLRRSSRRTGGPTVFINYRRRETIAYAGRLHDSLKSRIRGVQVFMDIDTLRPGDDFVDAINDAVASSDVTLVLIGDQWNSLADDQGHRRLDNPDDFVRLEIEASIVRGIRTIPVLLDGARMPRPEELPDSIRKLARYHGFELTSSRWEYDVEKLVSSINETTRSHKLGSRDAGHSGVDAAKRRVDPSPSTPSTEAIPPSLAPGSKEIQLSSPSLGLPLPFAERRLAELNRSLKGRPASAAKLIERGKVLRILNRPDEANVDFHKALDLLTNAIESQPNDQTLLQRRAALFQELKHSDEARADLERALDLLGPAIDRKPYDVAVLQQRSQVLANLGRREEALRDLDHALQLKPKSVELLVARGDILKRIGRREEALRDFNRALELKPNDFRAKMRRDLPLWDL